MRKPIDKQDHLLLVEGRDDEHVFRSLLNYHGLAQACSIVQAFDPKKGGEKSGGYSTLREDFRVRLKAQNETRLGVVVDADLDLADRWRSLRDLLNEAGYASVPAMPEETGTLVRQDGMRTVVGVWVMPNNALPGALEDFLRFLVPTGDPFWEHAESSVACLPKSEAVETKWRNAENWRSKARIHTYLAWQKNPGTPLGQAITARYLTADASEVAPLVTWLRRLFVEDL